MIPSGDPPLGHPGRSFRSAAGRPDINPYVERIEQLKPWVVSAERSEELAGRWRAQIGKPDTAPLLLEVGPGNGFFFHRLAKAHPEAAVVGVEIRFKRVWMTATKALEQGLDNFRVVHHHCGFLARTFRPDELDAVYINHPDPWPKRKHHKQRLLQPSFVELLARLIRPGGEVWIKSDFAPYGPLCRELFAEDAWEELGFSADLHGEGGPLLDGNIETNYERKSREKGCRIMVAGFRLKEC